MAQKNVMKMVIFQLYNRYLKHQIDNETRTHALY